MMILNVDHPVLVWFYKLFLIYIVRIRLSNLGKKKRSSVKLNYEMVQSEINVILNFNSIVNSAYETFEHILSKNRKSL